MRMFREATGYNRHSRWDAHDILILVDAKGKQNEGIMDAGMRSRKFGTADERWDLVASYCTANGVDRNPRECRRQWINLFHGHYRRIRNWEKLPGVESFWMMSREKRKGNQLPATFHWEVFGQIETFLGRKRSISPSPSPKIEQECAARATSNDEFFGLETEQQWSLGQGFKHQNSAPLSGVCGEDNLGTGSNSCSCQKNKRKCSLTLIPGAENLREQLAAALQTSGKAWEAVLADKIRLHIEAINYNSELDRCQRKEQGDSLISVLSQLARCVERMVEKM